MEDKCLNDMHISSDEELYEIMLSEVKRHIDATRNEYSDVELLYGYKKAKQQYLKAVCEKRPMLEKLVIVHAYKVVIAERGINLCDKEQIEKILKRSPRPSCYPRF